MKKRLIDIPMSIVDLRGEWIGHYTSHFDEVVYISQKGALVQAMKITGDAYVPAGEITWRANVLSGVGEGQIAEYEFRNPRFVPGRLTIVSPERIIFYWLGVGHVEFRKDE